MAEELVPGRRLLMMGWRPALLLAGASIAGFLAIMSSSSPLFDDAPAGVQHGRGLLAAQSVRDTFKSPRTIAGLVLSVLVSLTSSVDRECGASLYLVLFAVLHHMPFRKAIALTAFTVALGSLAPGIASMSEPHVTERGVLALVDYPSTLLLLPTMYYGISWGVIINMWWPNWLLALLVVLVLAVSNAELVVSYVRILRLRARAKELGSRLRDYEVRVSSSGGFGAPELRSGSSKDAGGGGGDAMAAERESLLAQAHELRVQALHIEGMALLYPAFHVPSVQDVLDRFDVVLPTSEPGGRPLERSASAVTLHCQQADAMAAAMAAARYKQTRFTLGWKKWWALNKHFELGLVLKIVVVHLITEAVRHHTTKPCTRRFWIMLGGMTGLVTLFLIFVVTSYNRRRLWRGPHWVDGLREVQQLKKAAAAEAAEAIEAGGGVGNGSGGDAGSGRSSGDDAIAVVAGSGSGSGSSPTAAAGPPAGAGAGTAGGDGNSADTQQPGCCAKRRKRLPWVWVTAPEAITNTTACNSYNAYRRYTLPRFLVVASITLGIGVMGCALGMPSGPAMAGMLLALGIKPHVVAGSSRFLVLCFCFGSFVAYIIAGNLTPRLAAAYGLINLGLAPLGMLLFRRLRLRSSHLLLLSLVMGLLGMACLTIWQLVPLLARLAGTWEALPAGIRSAQAVDAATAYSGDTFEFQRYCQGKHYPGSAPHGGGHA